MSFQAMSWAVVKRLPLKEKFTLVMLANYASSETGECFPSISTLASDTGMSQDSVIRAIKTLQSLGLVIVTKRKLGKVNLPNTYRLAMGSGVAAQSDHSPQVAVQVVAGSDSNQSIEPVIEKKKEKRARELVSLDAATGAFVVPEPIKAAWIAAYPQIDVSAQIGRAQVWCAANQDRQPKDAHRFLNGWLSRANNGVSRPALRVVGGSTKHQQRQAMTDWLFGPKQQEDSDVVDVAATSID